MTILSENYQKIIYLKLYSAYSRLEKEYQILQKFLDDERELNESNEFELASQALSYAKEVMSHQI